MCNYAAVKSNQLLGYGAKRIVDKESSFLRKCHLVGLTYIYMNIDIYKYTLKFPFLPQLWGSLALATNIAHV